MAITTVYKTEDGEVFTHIKEAEEHEKIVELWEKLNHRFATYGELKICYLSDFIDVMDFIKSEGGL